MKDYQSDFIELAIKKQALKFGKFILKSGRESPYFFNSGSFNTGKDLSLVGQYFTQLLQDSLVKYDIILGLAYKGIPILTTVAVTLLNSYGINIPYCFNRKEIKNYGDKGILIGGDLKGYVVIIDDVITSGISIYESISIINQKKAILNGIFILLDRQEKWKNQISTTKEIERNYCKVYSIITISDLITYLSASNKMKKYLIILKKYYNKYCI